MKAKLNLEDIGKCLYDAFNDKKIKSIPEELHKYFREKDRK